MGNQGGENVEAHQKGKYENIAKFSLIVENSNMQMSTFELRDGTQGTSHM